MVKEIVKIQSREQENANALPEASSPPNWYDTLMGKNAVCKPRWFLLRLAIAESMSEGSSEESELDYRDVWNDDPVNENNENVCSKKSEKLVHQSWHGGYFDHYELLKKMPKDKHLWAIDPRDEMSKIKRRKTCAYCNKVDHEGDQCPHKPLVCPTCGAKDHYEPPCPVKMCFTCGSSHHLREIMCENCFSWHLLGCFNCGRLCQPVSRCAEHRRRS